MGTGESPKALAQVYWGCFWICVISMLDWCVLKRDSLGCGYCLVSNELVNYLYHCLLRSIDYRWSWSILLDPKEKKDYVAPWIAFIVGVHFFWLVNVFKDSSLYILAILLIVIAALSLWLSKKLKIANSAVTGIGSGTALFCFAVLGLIRYLLV